LRTVAGVGLRVSGEAQVGVLQAVRGAEFDQPEGHRGGGQGGPQGVGRGRVLRGLYAEDAVGFSVYRGDAVHGAQGGVGFGARVQDPKPGGPALGQVFDPVLGHDPALVDDDHSFSDGFDLAEDVRRQDDRAVAGRQLAEQLAERAGRGPGRW